MCYRIVTMAVLPLLLKRLRNVRGITAEKIKGGSWLACDGIHSVWLIHRVACIAGKPAPTLTESFLREAFQADERASGEQVAQTLAVRQLQVGWR